MLMKEGWGEKKGGKERIENVHWKETEPLDVLHKVPVGRKPAKRASQEIPDKGILLQEKAERCMSQTLRLSCWAGLSSSQTGGEALQQVDDV